MSRLLLVSNRLPVSVRPQRGEPRIVPSAGGLATALGAARGDALWIGWPGELGRITRRERGALDSELLEAGLVPVHLSAAEVAQFYDGFSNGVLWPLLHYLIESVRLDAAEAFRVYRDVNRRFAERAAAAWRPGDVVWVHDYQLALVPSMLRELRPDARIGFFLHVPFPSPEVFETLPWRAPILHGILGADVIGFHTTGYAKNFRTTASEVANARPVAGENGVLRVNGRIVRVQTHPIGIDFAEFERLARSDEVEAELRRLREQARGRKIILGVDRLDYTKGILRRLLAFDQLLEQEPHWRDDVMFVQVGVPSREKVEAYARLRRSVNELVGRINAHHGSTMSAPVRFLYRSLSKAHLIALYRAADVMLVTPLRDGMNLVSKEYVASRVDDRGALVLSEFAGAAAELREAFIVNPYDLGAIVTALKKTLTMKGEDQATRMRALRRRVARGDVHAWVRRFVRELEDSRQPDASDAIDAIA